ncbi:MAG TPA: ROK family protein [Thermohalobaculum sp.]|nr:ROK family protein [Thermohalobaculum sp.]
MAGWRLVADVGGTNVRFARALEGGGLADRAEHGTAGFPAFSDALRAYLAALGDAGGCAGASIAAAGPVSGDRIRLTNGAWTIERGEVSRLLGGAEVGLFNDLQAAALSIPWLEARDLGVVLTPDGAPGPDGALLAVNVGTGFGAATLVGLQGGWASLASEAGHMTLGATTAAELALGAALHPPAASIEDVLSGAGMVNLYRHFAASSAPPADLHAEEVLARVPHDRAARQAADTFTALLGRVAGDLALATAAWAGVYMFGGVVLGWHRHADLAAFRAQFTAKGKMSARMASVPVYVVTNEAAPLIGLARS